MPIWKISRTLNLTYKLFPTEICVRVRAENRLWGGPPHNCKKNHRLLLFLPTKRCPCVFFMHTSFSSHTKQHHPPLPPLACQRCGVKHLARRCARVLLVSRVHTHACRGAHRGPIYICRPKQNDYDAGSLQRLNCVARVSARVTLSARRRCRQRNNLQLLRLLAQD